MNTKINSPYFCLTCRLDDMPNDNELVNSDAPPKPLPLRKDTLPALSVVNKLHQQPFDKHRGYNVELMGYDECFNNLDTKVNRECLCADALRVLIQALFLPFFTVHPWLKLCRKKIRPRARPVDPAVPQFEVHVFIQNLYIFHSPLSFNRDTSDSVFVWDRIWNKRNKFLGTLRHCGGFQETAQPKNA